MRAFVLCPPFAEEKKGAHRLLVDLARELCRRGVPVLRFDYRGTGDSEGSFTDFTLTGAVQDTLQAIAYLRAQTGCGPVGLLGVRLGAALAAQAAQAPDSGVSALALWEPITNGRRYMQMNLRQKRIREMMTAASGSMGVEACGSMGGKATPILPHPHTHTLPQEGFDFDGYWITPALQAELDALTFPAPAAGKAPERLLGVGINAAGRVAGELAALAASYTEAGTTVAVQAVAAEPFWSLQDPVPIPELIRVTSEWVSGE